MITLDPSQEIAVDLACTAPICIVTGGPGTGKTTILRAALDRLGEGVVVELASPTGKAAKRMAEATGREARTVHRLLGYGLGEGGSFAFGPDCTIPADVVVVDEASMLDVELASSLLDAIAFAETRLVLVGDANQLPSVGPGRVFADLIASGEVPVARLTTLHRSAAESWICRNAPRVLAGEMPELGDARDFRWHACSERSDASAVAVGLVVERPERQILVPQNTGPAGADALNAAVQAQLNPPRGGAPGWRVGHVELRVADRVIHTRNNYGLRVFNGEVGRVVEVTAEKLLVDFDDRVVTYDREQAGALRLAYALTVHKAQGSEWPDVVVLCHSTHTHMLSRPLLYTAITRAKRSVRLVGDPQGLEAALRNARDAQRNTGLVERLRGAA